MVGLSVAVKTGCALQSQPIAARRVGGRRVTVVRAASKGFGSGSKPSKREDEGQLVEGQGGDPRRLKSKGKKLARQPQPTQMAPQLPVPAEARESLVDELEFQKRLDRRAHV